jgi:hypothetical protein
MGGRSIEGWQVVTFLFSGFEFAELMMCSGKLFNFCTFCCCRWCFINRSLSAVVLSSICGCAFTGGACEGHKPSPHCT